jgi:hypothetical protein
LPLPPLPPFPGASAPPDPPWVLVDVVCGGELGGAVCVGVELVDGCVVVGGVVVVVWVGGVVGVVVVGCVRFRRQSIRALWARLARP